ncbi:Asp-tRNA(Asn)/Glu-tRNA(Gln) amidotransferase subunit GatC [Candidatus Uhrbacteria bacterium]|nr:Asp-tRNA(Asn)/Glu-tRNA(Gln) amidotransferase subunit GatC [Candidatus Uhrbacteria bacterium]
MALTKQDIEHIARLARLELSEEEKERFSSQLSSILDYVGQLSEVDTKGVEYHYHVEGLFNVMAPDEIGATGQTARDALLAAMPDRTGDLLKVKSVFQ